MFHCVHEDARDDRDRGQEQPAHERDPADELREVALRRRPRPDPGDEAALLADQLGLLVRLEDDVHVEEREREDQDEVDGDVERRRRVREVVAHPGLVARPRHDVADQVRDVQDRAREDDRDHAGLVHLERDVGRLAHRHPPPDHAPRERHRDPPLALVHEDDEDQQGDRHRDQHAALEPPAGDEDGVDPRRDARDDVGEDEQAHALAHAALGDELGHPHDHGGARGQAQHHERPRAGR